MKKILLVLIMALIAHGITYTASWWNDAVFYEVFVRSFYDSDKDGVGDIKGLTLKLDYLNDGQPQGQDLGVDALWLTPIFKCGSYHGYDTEDYYSINPEFGSMKDFEELIEEAHKRGIKIILDLVINHSSYKHPWFEQSSQGIAPYKDYYVWEDKIPAGDWGKPWGGGSPQEVWNYYGLRKAWYYSAFNYRMPDLNLKNKTVQKEIFDICRFWLAKGVDGFRLDAARYVIEDGPRDKQADTRGTIQWWKDLRKYVKSINPEAILVGEVWTSNDRVARYYNRGNGLDLCFNFDLAEKIPTAARYGNMKNIIESINKIKKLKAPLEFYAPFLSNHDTIRSMNILDNDLLNAKIACLLLLTMPGTPFIYYGEEIGLVQENGKNDKLKRAPMLWNSQKNAGFSTAKELWFPQIQHDAGATVEKQSVSPQSLWQFYKTMITVRKEYPALRSSDIKILDTGNSKALCYERTSPGQKMIILLNGSKSSQDISTRGLLGKKWKDVLSGEEFVFEEKRFTLNSKQYQLLLEQ